MPTQDKIGENDGIDSGIVDDVSYIPTEKTAGSEAEKSDAQLVADGEMTLNTGDEEIFVSPDGAWKIEDTSKKKEVVKTTPEETPSENKPGEKPEEHKEEKKKPPASAPDPIQKRINKLVREKYDADRAKDAAELENKQLREKLETLEKTSAKQEIESAKPKADDFPTEEDYHVALGRWAAKMEMHETGIKKPEEKPIVKQDADSKRKAIIDLGSESFDDFIEKVSSISITKEMFEAIEDSEHAHEVFYYLANNPEQAQAISKITSPIAIARKLGHIERQFEESNIEVDENIPNDPELSKPKTQLKVSSAPEPVKPVGGTAKVSKPLEELPIADYYAKRGYTRDGMKKR